MLNFHFVDSYSDGEEWLVDMKGRPVTPFRVVTNVCKYNDLGVSHFASSNKQIVLHPWKC